MLGLAFNLSFGLLFWLSACNPLPTYPPSAKPEASIVLTFDDTYPEAWAQALPIFERYQLKATFFLTRTDSLSPIQIKLLQELQQAGHQLAAHGNFHLSAPEAIDSLGFPNYWAKEIQPNLNFLHSLGGNTRVFAYPYGACSKQTHRTLLDSFQLLRTCLAFKPNNPAHNKQALYQFNGERVITALGIDNHYLVPKEALEDLAASAQQGKTALVLFGHEITSNASAYGVDTARLHFIGQLKEKYKLKSIHFSELASQ